MRRGSCYGKTFDMLSGGGSGPGCPDPGVHSTPGVPPQFFFSPACEGGLRGRIVAAFRGCYGSARVETTFGVARYVSRSSHPERHGGRWLGHAPLPGRCRRKAGADRRDRPHKQPRRGSHRRRGHDRGAGLHRRPHPHGCASGLGPSRKLLLLARRDHRGDGQLRLCARALQAGSSRVVCRVPGGGRGHSQGRDGRRHRLALGDLPGIYGRRRFVPQEHQLRRLYRPFGAAHVCDGRPGAGPGGQ